MNSPESFDVVRMYDPALVEACEPGDLGDYSSTRDLEALDIPEGCKPIVFRCRLLSRRSRRTVTEQASVERKYEVAFRLGVLSILSLPDRNGHPRDWTANRSKPWDALTDDALDETGLGDVDIWEIGSVVMSRSFLALGTPLACPQLDSSVRAWVATSTHHRLAEQSTEAETPPAD